ncbi:MAG: zinc-binding dehydrogenase, partial [Actinobacteria bacterium]|nr:zinc-binding dehydrogenase [Actinomycetota bacterium]
MKAGRIKVATREFSVVDIPIPVPGDKEVLIEVKAAGV